VGLGKKKDGGGVGGVGGGGDGLGGGADKKNKERLTMTDSLAMDSIVVGLDGVGGGMGGLLGGGFGGAGASSSANGSATGADGSGNALGFYKRAEEVYELMYVVQTAEHFEEWNIVKTNRWGRAQKRVIGIGRGAYNSGLSLVTVLCLRLSFSLSFLFLQHSFESSHPFKKKMCTTGSTRSTTRSATT
jgi:hypothetical protein